MSSCRHCLCTCFFFRERSTVEVWIKQDEDQTELHHLLSQSHLVDLIPIEEHTITAIDGNRVLSTCDTTTEGKPLCVINEVTVWIKMDGWEADCYSGLPKSKLVDLLPGSNLAVTFENQKMRSMYLWRYPKTEQNNPLIVQTKIFVWVKHEDSKPELEEFPLDSTANCVIPSDDFLVHQGNKLLSTQPLVHLKTTYENPLCVKRKEVKVIVFNEVNEILVPNDTKFRDFVKKILTYHSL